MISGWVIIRSLQRVRFVNDLWLGDNKELTEGEVCQRSLDG